jgi:hypothetical protein
MWPSAALIDIAWCRSQKGQRRRGPMLPSAALIDTAWYRSQ